MPGVVEPAAYHATVSDAAYPPPQLPAVYQPQNPH